MNEVILTAIISGLCVVMPTIMATRASNNKCIALSNIDLQTSVIERMAIVDRDLKTTFRYVDELKERRN